MPFQNTISVVIPVHNRSGFIGRCLDSVIAQTLPALEIIVVDDCSTDDLHAVIEEYGYNTVRYIPLPEKANAALARNVGAKNAKGEYVAFLDSDDVWLPHHLESKLTLLATNPEAKGAYGAFKVAVNGKELRNVVPKPFKPLETSAVNYILCGTEVSTSSLVVDRNEFLVVRFDPLLNKHQNWDFFIRFVSRNFLVLDKEPTNIIEVGLRDRMSAVPNHEASSRFLKKHEANMGKSAKARFYSALALTTYMHEGRSPMFRKYMRNIPWNPLVGLRPIMHKAFLTLPFSRQAINLSRKHANTILSLFSREAKGHRF
jgi:glycosyltransferase involved in cell wall biosynthesis